MFGQRCSFEAPVPRAWAWAALADARNLARWSPVRDCELDGSGTLTVGDEVGCTLEVLGQPVGATMCVIDVRPEHCLGVRTETLAATVFETVTVTSLGPAQTLVRHELDVLTPVPGPSLAAWVREHAQATCDGLAELLRPEDAGRGAGRISHQV